MQVFNYMSFGERVEVVSTVLAVVGLFGLIGFAMSVQATTLGTGPDFLKMMGEMVIETGTVGDGIYIAPAIALSVAAFGALGMLVPKLLKS